MLYKTSLGLKLLSSQDYSVINYYPMDASIVLDIVFMPRESAMMNGLNDITDL